MKEMSTTKLTFKRFEKKYILTAEKYENFMAVAGEHLIPDEYFKSTVMSIYYDSADYTLIRRSIERPVFKEKLRIRSYGTPGPNTPVFVELKKKYKGIVYKRRVGCPVGKAEAWVAGTDSAPEESQTTKEIDWFLQTNKVEPKAFIGCDRIAWKDKDDPELRITFDEKIRWRDERLSLSEGDDGQNLLEDGCVLMEIKIPEAVPLWLARLLSEESIFPTSYSKYGTCYVNELLEKTQLAL